MDKNVHQMVLLLPALNLIKLFLNNLQSLLQPVKLLLKLLLLRQLITPTFEFLRIFLAFLDLFEQNLEKVHLFFDFILGRQKLFDSLVWITMLLSIFLQIAIQVKSEIKVKFMLIFQSLTLLSIVIGSIYIEEEVLRLVSNKGWLFVEAAVYLNFKVELLVKRFV